MTFTNPIILLVIGVIIALTILLVYYKLNKTNGNKCPACSCDHCDRVKRPFLIKLFFFFISNLKYYRCPGCDKQFMSVVEKGTTLQKRYEFLKIEKPTL